MDSYYSTMSKKAANGELNALVSLIQSSVDSIISEYAQAGLASPSLDTTSSTIHHANDLDAPKRVAEASKIVVAACAQLSVSVIRPERAVLTVRISSFYLGLPN